MTQSHTLTHHRDIQNWVTARHGMPAISRVPDVSGSVRQRLALSFGKHGRPTGRGPDMDDGVAPVSWSAWLAELDRQHLALKVSNQKTPDFEFVERQELSRTSGEALN